ncbi:hypothetical protein ACRAWD_10305 [Caulobacter segnis]
MTWPRTIPSRTRPTPCAARSCRWSRAMTARRPSRPTPSASVATARRWTGSSSPARPPASA